MSYKYTVLQDYPLSFFLLDEVRSGEVGAYLGLISTYSTYQDLKDNGVSYAAVSGLPIIDYSGNAMEGYAIETSSMEVLPIVAGGKRGTEINEASEISLKALGIATNKNPDSPFALEIWFKADNEDVEEYCIFGDINNDLGIFYTNENITFKVSQDNSICYKVSKNKAVHIVGIYSKDKISLFVDGKLVNEKSLFNEFKFLNESISLSLGPANIGSKFIVDAAAVYNYEIEENRILSHYTAGYKDTKPSQIVYTNNGILFSLNSSSLKPGISYRYPGIEGLERLSSQDGYYDAANQKIVFNKTLTIESKIFSFTETLYVGNPEKIVSSNLIYGQDVDNVVVEIMVPGEDWAVCKNNSPLPYYNKNQNSHSGFFDLRVTMTTNDSSFDLPYFNRLEIDMYLNKDFYSDNSGFKIYSNYDYTIGEYNYPIRIQNKYNGISMYEGHGFSTDVSTYPQTIEMFFSPDGNSNVLFSSADSYFKWNSSGAITKSGISSIYVNGINRTSSTNISDFFLNGVSHYLIIALSSPATNIKFNQNQDGTEYGYSNVYNNIAFYTQAFVQNDVLKNYSLYRSDNSNIIQGPSLVISEDDNGVDNTPNYVRVLG
jgi:hypothetical protein